ncbi:MAG: T9SS type A sorting domain-containing protein [Bacteroidota bacterium]
MKKWTFTLFLSLVFTLLSGALYLQAQSMAFNRIYPEASDFTLFNIEQEGDELWVYGFRGYERLLLRLTEDGVLIDVEPLPDVVPSLCILPSLQAGEKEIIRIDDDELVVLSELAPNRVELKKRIQPDCTQEDLVRSWKRVIEFDTDNIIRATSLRLQSSPKAEILLAGYEYTNDLDVAPAKYQLRPWVLKMDLEGNELWRYEFDDKKLVANSSDASMTVALIRGNGTILMNFKDADGDTEQWYLDIAGLPTDGAPCFSVPPPPFNTGLKRLLSVDCNATDCLTRWATSTPNGHMTQHLARTPDCIGLSYSLNASGPAILSRDGGIILAERGVWIDGIRVRKVSPEDGGGWSYNYSTINATTHSLKELDNGRVFILGNYNGIPWILEPGADNQPPTPFNIAIGAEGFSAGLMGLANQAAGATPSQAIELFPNPASDQVLLKMTLDQPNKVQVQAFNALGQPLFSQAHVQHLGAGLQDWQVDIQDWPSGIYTLYIQIGDQSYSRLLFKS